MNKISKVLKGGVIAAFAALVIAAPVFAFDSSCVGPNSKYPNLSTAEGSSEYTVKCPTVGGVTLYGKSSADCAQAATIISNPEGCKGNDLNNVVQVIINTLIFVIGMVAVVMIIIGGINYTTSQGDAGKVKKGKDTILYGIVGLVIAILAFAIVNFVLGALNG